MPYRHTRLVLHNLTRAASSQCWRRWCLFIWLSVSLLVVQTMGLQHALAHGGLTTGSTHWLDQATPSLTISPHPHAHHTDSPPANHSCLLLDAASLADSVDYFPPVFVLAAAPFVPVAAPPSTSHSQRFIRLFNGRAPPYFS